MDNKTLAERLASDQEFAKDYKAIRSLGAQMRGYAIRMHAQRLGQIVNNSGTIANIDGLVAPLVDRNFFAGAQWPADVVDKNATLSVSLINHAAKKPQTQEIAMSDKNFVKTLTLVGGIDFATMNDQAVYDKIAALEARVEQLDKIKTKPASLKAEIDQINANIAALVKLADERHAKKSAKADDAAAA